MDDEEENRTEKERDNLKNKRRGMKGGITKRIKEIKALVNEKQSRSQIKFLLGKLHEVLTQTRLVADKVVALIGDSSNTLWIQVVDLEVDLCTSVATD